MRNKFTVDAKTVIALGRNSVKDNTTALLELVKNSYDADATIVEVELFNSSKGGYIRVVDNGKGMTEEEVESNWLRIGYSIKNIETVSELGRRKTGEKGVGRLATDRLGSLLTLITKSKEHPAVGIKIDWEKFNKDNIDLSSIEIEELKNAKISSPNQNSITASSGTEVIIQNLRGEAWIEEEVDAIYQELAVLTPPFKNVEDFDIYFNTNVKKKLNGKIESPFFEISEIELTLEYKKDSPDIKFKIQDKYTSDRSRIVEQVIPWSKLSQKVTSGFDRNKSSKHLACGSVKVKLLFYPRDSSAVENTKFKLSDFREFLDINTGIKIYRDNIRVRPYGDSSDVRGDWLGLAERRTREPAGIARPTWRVSNNQVVGAAYIGRDTNEELIDKTSREGIMEDNNAFRDLRALVLGGIGLLETHRHNLYKKGLLPSKKKAPKEEVSNYEDSLNTFKTNLEGLKDGSKTAEEVLEQAEKVKEETEEIKKVVKDVYSKNKLLGGLATIGISSVVFGHETQSSIDQFILSTKAAIRALGKTPPIIATALSEVRKADIYGQKISAWGNFSLARVQKGKREINEVNLKSVLENVVEQLQPVFTAADIMITKELEMIKAKTYAMDIETIIINLLTNAYTACLQEKGERKVVLSLKSNSREKINGYEITVSDNGPGVDEDLSEMIWEPLFTTKKSGEGREIGTGMGLAIVQSIVEDMKGHKFIEKDKVLKGAKFKIWLPV